MMPKAKKKVIEVEIPESALSEFGEVPVADLPPDVDNVLKEIGEDVTRVLLYRRLRGEKQAYVGTVDADEFSMDEVARRWGGGRYLARLVGAEGIIKGMTFYIDESIKPQRADEREGHGGGNAVTDRLLERLIDKLGDNKPARDPMEIAASLGAVVASQLQTMMGLLTPLLAKASEGGGNAAGGSSAADILSAVELGISLGGKDEGYLPVIREVGLPLVKALESQLLARRSAPPVVRSAIPATTTPGEIPLTTPSLEPPWVTAARPYIGKLVEFATRGDDPNVWAGVLDMQFPAFAKWLESAVGDEAFEASLYKHFPELTPHREWVTAFLTEFLPEELPPQAPQEVITSPEDEGPE